MSSRQSRGESEQAMLPPRVGAGGEPGGLSPRARLECTAAGLGTPGARHQGPGRASSGPNLGSPHLVSEKTFSVKPEKQVWASPLLGSEQAGKPPQESQASAGRQVPSLLWARPVSHEACGLGPFCFRPCLPRRLEEVPPGQERRVVSELHPHLSCVPLGSSLWDPPPDAGPGASAAKTGPEDLLWSLPMPPESRRRREEHRARNAKPWAPAPTVRALPQGQALRPPHLGIHVRSAGAGRGEGRMLVEETSGEIQIMETGDIGAVGAGREGVCRASDENKRPRKSAVRSPRSPHQALRPRSQLGTRRSPALPVPWPGRSLRHVLKRHLLGKAFPDQHT